MKKSKILYSIGVIISILVIIIVLMFLVFQKKLDKNSNTIAEINNEENSGNIEMVSVAEDKSIEEVKKQENSISNETIKKEENKIEDKSKPKQEKTKEIKTNSNVTPTFKMPVEGEIIRNYAKDKLVYSDTLKEWTTHLGIDIKADKTSIVKSSSQGKVAAIKNDPRFGLSVRIEHSDGYATVYSNLLTAEFINVGEEVKQGQTIGTVGNTAAFEILDEPHLHFEILKDGVSVDPNMYL